QVRIKSRSTTNYFLGDCLMKNGFFAKPMQYSLAALAVLNLYSGRILAQESHAHVPTQQQQLAVSRPSQASAFINIVRESTARFQDVAVAEREGYTLQFGCVSGP